MKSAMTLSLLDAINYSLFAGDTRSRTRPLFLREPISRIISTASTENVFFWRNENKGSVKERKNKGWK